MPTDSLKLTLKSILIDAINNPLSLSAKDQREKLQLALQLVEKYVDPKAKFDYIEELKLFFKPLDKN